VKIDFIRNHSHIARAILVSANGKDTQFDPIGFQKERLELVSQQLKAVFKREDEYLRESFFMYFLMGLDHRE
jgi:hypothetical protein